MGLIRDILSKAHPQFELIGFFNFQIQISIATLHHLLLQENIEYWCGVSRAADLQGSLAGLGTSSKKTAGSKARIFFLKLQETKENIWQIL